MVFGLSILPVVASEVEVDPTKNGELAEGETIRNGETFTDTQIADKLLEIDQKYDVGEILEKEDKEFIKNIEMQMKMLNLLQI